MKRTENLVILFVQVPQLQKDSNEFGIHKSLERIGCLWSNSKEKVMTSAVLFTKMSPSMYPLEENNKLDTVFFSAKIVPNGMPFSS